MTVKKLLVAILTTAAVLSLSIIVFKTISVKPFNQTPCKEYVPRWDSSTEKGRNLNSYEKVRTRCRDFYVGHTRDGRQKFEKRQEVVTTVKCDCPSHLRNCYAIITEKKYRDDGSVTSKSWEIASQRLCN